MSKLKPATKGGNQPRGLRNNNPGNLRHSTDHWAGMSEQQTDPAFIQFQSMVYGCRALGVTLLTYQDKYKLNTIQELITRWAPPNENNTGAYINAVCSSVNKYIGIAPKVLPSQPVNLRRGVYLDALISAIVEHENGITVSLGSQLSRDILNGANLALGLNVLKD